MQYSESKVTVCGIDDLDIEEANGIDLYQIWNQSRQLKQKRRSESPD